MNKKIFFLLLSGIIMLLASAIIFAVPWTIKAFETEKDLRREQERLVKLRSKLNDLNGLNEFELEERRKIAFRALPSGKNFMEILGILTKLASDHGLFVESYKIAPGSISVTEKGQLDYKLTITGNLSDMRAYLANIERSLPLMNSVGKLNINWERETPLVTLTVETYFLPLPKTMGPLSSPIPKLTLSEEKYLTTLFTFQIPAQIPLSPVIGKTNPFSF